MMSGFERDLLHMGLTSYETKAYLTLLRMRSADGGTIAKKSGVPQSKVYEVLYRLVEKGLVSVLETRPKRFRTLKPERAFHHYFQRKRLELEELEQTIPEKLKGLTQWAEPTTEELITVYHGKRNTHPLILDKFVTVKKYLKEMLTFEYIPFTIQKEIKKCILRGVRIQMLATMKNKQNLPLIKKIRRLGVEVRCYPVQELRVAVKDGEESYQMIVSHRDLEDRITIVIESKELTKALEHYFDYVWKKAERV